jgi:predicted site-specific integrase-resolvase
MSDEVSQKNEAPRPVVEKLALNARELREALGISATTAWRLEKAGRIRSVAGIRTKIFPLVEVRRFLGENTP